MIERHGGTYWTIVITLSAVILGIVLLIIFESWHFILGTIEDTNAVASDSSATSTSTASKDWQVFTNSKYNLVFSYPKTYSIQETEGKNSDTGKFDEYTIVNPSNKDQYGAPQKIAQVILVKFDKSKTIPQATQEIALSGCNADGPCAHGSCPSVASQKQFISANKLSVFEYYVNRVIASYADEKNADGSACAAGEDKKVVGPVYFVDVSTLTQNQLQLIEITPDLLASSQPKDIANTLKQISESVKTSTP